MRWSVFILVWFGSLGMMVAETLEESDSAFVEAVLPVLKSHCVDCHSTRKQKGELDLEQFATLEAASAQSGVWEKVVEQVKLGEMPPEDADPLDAQTRSQLLQGVDQMLQRMAMENAGDPGPVVLRRLSNAEYTYTIRDLTGLQSLDPAREFPADSASGEGFMNVGHSLVMSPSMVEKFFDAAQEVAAHAVLTPEGIRFSNSVNRPDWAQENLEAIRAFYARYTIPGAEMSLNLQGIRFDSRDGGVIPLEQYLAVALELKNFDAMDSCDVEKAAEESGLSAKYLSVLLSFLNQSEPGNFARPLCELWQKSDLANVAAMAQWIRERQGALWTFNPVGHIGKRGGPAAWQTPRDPSVEELKTWVPEWKEWEELKIRETAKEQLSAFRKVFPGALCYTRIVPVDEVVTLSLYYQEDGFLRELMLTEAESHKLDMLWEELRFVSREALKLVDVYDQLWQYATQDADPSVFEPLRQPIRDRAEAFGQKLIQTESVHLQAIVDFADQAWRRPLQSEEESEIRDLYQLLREEELEHESAIRLLIARILVAPAFLYRLESPPDSEESGPVDDWELATRLSYFLWSSTPDERLRRLADERQLHKTEVLKGEAQRMLRDPKIRRLAEQFGTLWLNIYQLDPLVEKNEKRFPEFEALRSSIYREPIEFMTRLFQQDLPVLDFLDADYTYVNDQLADFYGITTGSGEVWRRVDNAKSFGRGGVLGFAATLTKQSGATRTSPILRGAWLSETLLGEKLPRPPKNVPPLPDDADSELISMRKLTERHTQDPDCSGCHRRIDPYGFALETYNAIGSWRTTDDAGDPVHAIARLPDGTEVNGVAGLKRYLVEERRVDFVRHFCRKLLGFALGREIRLSDRPLIDQMFQSLSGNDWRIGVAFEEIVTSQQFLQIRGAQYSDALVMNKNHSSQP